MDKGSSLEFPRFCFIVRKLSIFPLLIQCVCAGDDYSVASSDVVLLEGETSKPVPIYIINDREPELEETFQIELLNQTTGGAQLGQLTKAIITILPSDDPFGAFGMVGYFYFRSSFFGSFVNDFPFFRLY